MARSPSTEATHGRADRASHAGRTTRARNPAQRRTSKPDVMLERTSQTAILRTCMDTITECFDYCIQNGGKHADADHLRAHLDAWDLLSATSTLVARGSGLVQDLKPICAQAVKRCEESCERFEDDEMMKACADVCREAYEHLTS